jgi:hypothetical protein
MRIPMLHTSAVPVNLCKVLQDLQDLIAPFDFALAGGTSLALRFGHRVSVDLDFFTVSQFDPETLARDLGFNTESITGLSEGSLQLRIDNVKVEFLRHAYPKLADVDLINGVEVWSLQDVAAMKLNAISNRGSKKDFFDLVALLDHITLQNIINLYQAKYRPASLMMVIRSLAWFDDADAEPDPISLREDSWDQVMKEISTAIRSLE